MVLCAEAQRWRRRKTFPCPCFPCATSFTQDTAGLDLQDQVKLPYNLYLLAGLRYQYLHEFDATGATPSTEVPDQGTPTTAQRLRPRFGLLWRPQDWVSFYGNYAESFGPNMGLIFPNTPVRPTNASSWEAGGKLEFLTE